MSNARYGDLPTRTALAREQVSCHLLLQVIRRSGRDDSPIFGAQPPHVWHLCPRNRRGSGDSASLEGAMRRGPRRAIAPFGEMPGGDFPVRYPPWRGTPGGRRGRGTTMGNQSHPRQVLGSPCLSLIALALSDPFKECRDCRPIRRAFPNVMQGQHPHWIHENVAAQLVDIAGGASWPMTSADQLDVCPPGRWPPDRRPPTMPHPIGAIDNTLPVNQQGPP